MSIIWVFELRPIRGLSVLTADSKRAKLLDFRDVASAMNVMLLISVDSSLFSYACWLDGLQLSSAFVCLLHLRSSVLSSFFSLSNTLCEINNCLYLEEVQKQLKISTMICASFKDV